jgi:hypothetical protein
MRRNAIGVLFCCIAVITIALPIQAFGGQGAITGTPSPKPRGEATVKPTGTAGCNLIDFDDLGDVVPIGTIPGPVSVTFGTSWYVALGYDGGGCCGNIANEPSASGFAVFPYDANDIRISLSPSVQYLEFFYSAAARGLPVTVTAYDSGDNVVDVAVGNTIGTDYDGAPCTGDPNGNFCSWSVISLTAAADNIAYVTIAGPPENVNYFVIDNLQFCTEEQEQAACCLPDGTCAQLTAEGCRAAGGTWYQGRSCEGADCETVPTKSSTWGGIKALYRTP